MQKIYLNSEKQDLYESSAALPDIVDITNVSDNPNWTYAAHKHDNRCEIGYIRSGKAYYTIDNKHYDAVVGDVVIINKGSIHAESSDRKEPLNKWMCGITGLRLINRLEDVVIPPDFSPIIHMGNKAEVVENCFQIIYDACINSSKNAYVRSQFAISLILSLIDDEINPTIVVAKPSLEKTMAETVMKFIDNNFAQPITMDMLANLFFVSASHLGHIIKNEVGISPINYLINRRIGEAQKLLLSTMLPITTIATMVGFPNINHFSNSFKKVLNISPGQFRKDYNVIFFQRKETQSK